MVTTTGKKQITPMTASLGRTPKPHQNTSSGATTTIGTAWEATSSGYRARCSVGERWTTTARAKPTTSDTTMPRPTSWAVMAKFDDSRPALFHSAAATSCGAGSTNGSTPPVST